MEIETLPSLFDHRVVTEPVLELFVDASCSHFHAPSAPEFERFRRTLKLYAGDFDLRMYRAKRAPGGPSFEDFCSAFCVEASRLRRSRVPDERWTFEALVDLWGDHMLDELYVEHLELRSAGAMLWEFGRFACMCWDWKDLNRREGFEAPASGQRGGAYMRGQKGQMFIARVFCDVPWDADPVAMAEVLAQARHKLSSLPEPRHGIPRHRFAALMGEDISRLQAMCGRGECFADVLMDDASAPLERVLVIRNDGNDQDVCWQTEETFYAVRFSTS